MDGDPLRRLAAAARREQTLIVRGLTDRVSMLEIIWPAFRADVAPWAELDYAQDVVAGRVLAAVRDAPSDRRPAVVLVSNPSLFDRAGLLEPLDTPFAEHFPAGWIDAERRWMPVYVQPIVAIYNAHRQAPPRDWTDLAAPRVRGRVVFDDPARMLTSGPAFAELSATWGEKAWSAALRAVGAAEPRLVADNERAVLEVSTGARWIGLANWNVARRVRGSSPVRHTFLRPTPCVPGFGLLVAGAASASLGRLFLAWLSSEGGQRAYAATGRIPARPDVDAVPSLGSVLPPGVEPLFGAADWVSHPERWVERYRELLPADRDAAAEGKVR